MIEKNHFADTWKKSSRLVRRLVQRGSMQLQCITKVVEMHSIGLYAL